MSAWIKTYSLADLSDQSLIVAQIEADELADLPGISDFTGRTLCKGSTAHVIDGNTMHELNSAGVWIRQDEAGRFDVYTKAETDSQIMTAVTPIDEREQNLRASVGDLLGRDGKNIANWRGATQTITDVTFTNNGDGTITTAGTAAARRQKLLYLTLLSDPGYDTYMLTGCPEGGEISGSIKYALYLYDATANVRVSQNDTGAGIMFDWTPDTTHTYQINVDIRAGTNASGLIFRPMIIRRTDYLVNPYFTPYIPSNADLYALIKSYHP